MQRRVRQAGRAIASMAGIVAVIAAAACGADNPSGPDNTPATVTANSTIPASAVIASPVLPAPSVIVKNAAGAPLPNVRVTFVVTAGDGLAIGTSQLTDAGGVATVDGWYLGDNPGVQTLVATAGGKTVSFTMQATNDCSVTGAIAAGQTVTGDLRTSPCGLGDGSAVQSWTFTQASGQSAVAITMHATGAPTFNTFLLLHRTTYTAFDNVLAINDNDAGSEADSRMNIILGAGTYVVSANNYEPGVAGPFSMTADAWSGDFENCDDAFVTTGITTTQNMTSSCPNPQTGQYVDFVVISLAQGQQVQFDMSSSAFDPKLELYTGGFDPVAQDDNTGGGTSARLVYTAPTAGFYILLPTSPAAAQTGTYTLTVTAVSGTPTGPAQLSAPAPGAGLRERPAIALARPWGRAR
jgi:hypothetical protein